MRELAARTGLPRTTIHHYLREGLLPPARSRPAPNAAEYGEEHVRRLELIAALRSDELGPIPLAGVRAVVAAVEAGMTPEAAAAMWRGVGSTGRGLDDLTAEGVAGRAGVEPRRLREWIAVGLLLPRGDLLDEADAEMAVLYGRLFEATGVEPADLAPVAEVLREAGAYERTLAELARSRAGSAEEAGRRVRKIAGAMEAMIRYVRARELEGVGGGP